MLPDTTVAASPGHLAQTPRARLAGLVQAISVLAFLAAAAAMLGAGALQSAGRPGTSSLLATLGYALGVAGIAAGVTALALDPDARPDTTQETA